jgi:hypothetical protein
MKLIHTLLFLLRDDIQEEDLELAKKCLKSLEKSTYKTVVIYNQGNWSNDEVIQFVESFDLNCIVIGESINVGTSAGRQACFDYIWNYYPCTEFISEIHLDMIFTFNWEDALIDYLNTEEEPMVSCGIVDQTGTLSFINKTTSSTPKDFALMDDYLIELREDVVVHGFTNPCIHKSSILKHTGGYNTQFLVGKQAFEDDSMLLGYYYYYGTKNNWKPKVCYKSVVYHAVAGQRMGMGDSVMINFMGLTRQYGAMGLKHLSELHTSQWHIQFFTSQYETM